MNARAKTVLVLILLAVLYTVIPLPITGLILLYVLASRTPWFARLVRDIFETDSRG